MFTYHWLVLTSVCVGTRAVIVIARWADWTGSEGKGNGLRERSASWKHQQRKWSVPKEDKRVPRKSASVGSQAAVKWLKEGFSKLTPTKCYFCSISGIKFDGVLAWKYTAHLMDTAATRDQRSAHCKVKWWRQEGFGNALVSPKSIKKVSKSEKKARNRQTYLENLVATFWSIIAPVKNTSRKKGVIWIWNEIKTKPDNWS